jgi:hypothetical protein
MLAVALGFLDQEQVSKAAVGGARQDSSKRGEIL